LLIVGAEKDHTVPASVLASPGTANVTGANYVIDGGLVKTT